MIVQHFFQHVIIPEHFGNLEMNFLIFGEGVLGVATTWPITLVAQGGWAPLDPLTSAGDSLVRSIEVSILETWPDQPGHLEPGQTGRKVLTTPQSCGRVQVDVELVQGFSQLLALM